MMVWASFATIFVCGASAAFTNDPRCPADFDPLKSCPSSMILPGGSGFDLTRNLDPTTCNDQENCPRCLGDDTWQQKLKDEVGLYDALRDPDFKPWVMVNCWLSHAIVSTITMILLREAMNISARAAAQGADGTLMYICCSEAVLNMEQWPGGRTPADPTHTVTELAGGYTGQSGLFVPPHTLEKYPLAFTYHSYRLVDEYKHIFPPSFSTDCTNMTVVSSAGCTAGNYVCETNAWTNTTCYDGKWYVPPQCNILGEVGNPNTTHCQEVLMADPTYDDGFFEGLIKNNGLNMTAAYIGTSQYTSYIRDLAERKQDFMFYWYEPDPLISAVGAEAIAFAPNTPECNAELSPDPTLNTAKCGYPVLTLLKQTQSAVLAQHADYKHFFNSFSLTRAQLESLLTQHTSAGGNATVYDASCNWIKNNFDTWKDAVQNTPPTQSTQITASTTSVLSNKGVLAALIVVPVLFLIAIVAFVTWTCCKHQMALKNAPQTAPLALVFTDIESSTMLWEACGDDMGLAVEIHHAIIRKHIEEFGAYEVKTIGDSFMIACSSLGDATLMCLAIQTSLGECRDFPPSLRFEGNPRLGDSVTLFETQQSGMDNELQIRDIEGHTTTAPPSKIKKNNQGGGVNKSGEFFHFPLRVRIGLHWCQEVTPTKDRIHGHFDYYGHDVNVCARVEGQGIGGQIMVTSDTMEAIMETDEYPFMIAPDSVSAIVKRNVELKGVSTKASLYGLAPTSQLDSGYVPSRALQDSRQAKRCRSRSQSSNGGTSSNGLGMGFEQISAVDSKHIQASVTYSTALLRATFKAVPDSAKSAWLSAVAKLLRIKNFNESTSSAGQTEQSARFDAIRSAVIENCTSSLNASAASTYDGGRSRELSVALESTSTQ